MLNGLGEDMPLLIMCSICQRSRSQGSLEKTKFSLIILRTINHRAFIFHMLIGLMKDMTPVDFVFTRSKVKVTRVTLKKKENCFLFMIYRNVYHRSLILYMMIGLGEDITS